MVLWGISQWHTCSLGTGAFLRAAGRKGLVVDGAVAHVLASLGCTGVVVLISREDEECGGGGGREEKDRQRGEEGEDYKPLVCIQEPGMRPLLEIFALSSNGSLAPSDFW